ncbi:MAG: polymer-forming cytoskeletal protein [Candidatus Eisenbacteria bacterium]|nr:polymer-forming cytoskeletal protein [Candidatus Eisenbacteria bacterium]
MAMFGRQKDSGAPSDTRINTVIGEGTLMTGTLRVEGSLLVNGEFEGTLTATESAIIGKTGSVRAGISAREILVAGKVRGKVLAKERVELQTGARLEGDVIAKSFMIEEGVFFQGNCSMGEEVSLEESKPIGSSKSGGAGTHGDTASGQPGLGLLGQR